jgi:hypothetical protein
LTSANPIAPTPITGSENVAVHPTLEALVGDAFFRTIEATVGAVTSIDQVYDVAALVAAPETARTRNVCDPGASGPAYVFVLGRVVPQSENADPSSAHWNFVIAWASVYVNDADWMFVGFSGTAESVGAGNGGAASAAYVK